MFWWLKGLKIGTQMLTGFGIVCVLFLALGIIISVLNNRTIDQIEIAENISQASQGIQEVTESISQVASVTKEIAQNITGVNAATMQVNESSVSVNANAGELRTMSQTLEELISRYKV